MRAELLRAILIVSLLSSACCAVEITNIPETTPAAPMQVTVTWGTDVASDSLVDYGVGGEYTHSSYSPIYTTEHSVTVPLFVTDDAYEFRVTSGNGIGHPAVDYTWYYNYDYLVCVQLPEADEIVSEEVRLNGAPAHTNTQVLHALFEVIPDATGIPIYIGEDNDGTEFKYATELPSLPGDGWSAYWGTFGFPEGGYTVRVTMTTAIGIYNATQWVWLDHTPPTPNLNDPPFGARRSGLVGVGAGGAADSVTCDFKKKAAEPVIVTFNTAAMLQTDYGFAGVPGSQMCHPTTQAMILWTNPVVQNIYLNCRANPTHDESVGKTLLVRDIALKKRTDASGTGGESAKRGSEEMIDYLRDCNKDFDWKFHDIPKVMDAKTLKKEATNPPGQVMGVGLNLRWNDKDGQHGHTVALKNLDDNEKKDDKGPYREVTITNPSTKQDETYRLRSNGHMDYKGNDAYIGSGFKFTSPPPKMFMAADWELIGTDNNPADGWSVIWDTSGEAPGLYYLKAEATDTAGMTGWDVTEVALPAVVDLPNAKLQADGASVDVSGTWSVTQIDGENYWVEATSRAGGIGVMGGYPLPQRNETVMCIKGSMTTDGAERKIAAYEYVPGGSTVTITALGMPNKSVAGGDSLDAVTGYGQVGATDAKGLNNVGMLARTWGEITDRESGSPPSWIKVDDGSGVIVKCMIPTGVVVQPTWQHVGVSGIVTLEEEEPELRRLILVRDQDDLAGF